MGRYIRREMEVQGANGKTIRKNETFLDLANLNMRSVAHPAN